MTSTAESPTAPASFFARWSEVIRQLPVRSKPAPEEPIGPQFEIKITRAGTDDYIHLSGFVPLDCLILDAEIEAERLGWLEQRDE